MRSYARVFLDDMRDFVAAQWTLETLLERFVTWLVREPGGWEYLESLRKEVK